MVFMQRSKFVFRINISVNLFRGLNMNNYFSRRGWASIEEAGFGNIFGLVLQTGVELTAKSAGNRTTVTYRPLV